MTIDALPTAPSSSPSTFAARADAWVAALATWTTQANALAAAMNLNATTASSSLSVAIGTGSKSFTVDTGKSYQVGMSVMLAYDSSNWMHGQVTSYDSGTGALVVNVVNYAGSGTKTSWTVTLSAPAYSLAATTALAGIVELLTDAEALTGTDAARAATAANLAYVLARQKRILMIKLADDETALATGDGKYQFPIPTELNGYNLVDAQAMVSTVSSSGTPTYQIRNVTDAVDMLSTRITIDANEKTSYTAATPRVINTSYDDVATGDIIAIDKDVAGTGCKGDSIILVFQLP